MKRPDAPRQVRDFGNWSTATVLIFLVGLGALIRNLAVNYPLIFGDEGIYLIRSKYLGREQMLAGNQLATWIPNSLYLWINHFIFYFGANYAIGARLLNVLFYVLSLIILYALASIFVSRGNATLLALAAGIGPMSVYTACVIPETLFLCAFLLLTLVLLWRIHEHPIYTGLLSGLVIGAASLIKPHGLMLIPIVLLALVILKLTAPEWCSWITCAGAAAAVLGAAFLMLGFLNYLIVGQWGFSLGPNYTNFVHKTTTASPLASIAYVIQGHVALILSLYALPVLIVLMALRRGSVRTRTLAERVQVRGLLIFTILAGSALLIASSKFTVSVAGSSIYEQANRLHVRYYFFVLPLLLVLFPAVYERLDWKTKSLRYSFIGGSLAMCALAAYSILGLDRRYFMLFADFPDGFWFNMNHNIGRVLVFLCTCGMLLVYAWRRMPPAVFLAGFGFISLVGNYYVSLFLLQPATETDRAATVLDKVIGSDRLDAGTIFDTEPGDGEVYRLLFDLPAAYDLKVITGSQAIPADALPDAHQWALVTSARPVEFQYADSFTFGRYHLYLRHLRPAGAEAVRNTESAVGPAYFTGACAGAQLVGFHAPEWWGVWSAGDPAEIVLRRSVKGPFHMVLVAHVLDKVPAQNLHVEMDNATQSIEVRADSTALALDFDLRAAAQRIVLRGITPKSPFGLGLSADSRPLGLAIQKLDCAGKAAD